jgi:hypothetical protein
MAQENPKCEKCGEAMKSFSTHLTLWQEKSLLKSISLSDSTIGVNVAL